jgi:transcriptional antiterminator RfaH
MQWVVAQSQPNREQWACENIARLGHQTYFPRISKITLVRGQRIAGSSPLFPRYLFVGSPGGQWRFLLGTWGVAGVVLVGSGPAFVSDQIIADLRNREQDGLVILPQFRPGQELRVKDGPFKNERAIYQGSSPKEREEVLLNFLGRKTKVLIARELLEVA